MSHFDKKFDGLAQRVTQLEEQSKENTNNIAQVTIIANDAKSQCSSNSVAIGTLETETDALSVNNESLLKRVEALEKHNDILAIRTNVAEQRLEDQTNRSLRKTVIIRGVPEEDHEDWKETRVVGVAALQAATKMNNSYINKGIERIHRGEAKGVDDANYKKRPIYLVCYDWNFVEEVLDNFGKHGRTSGIFIDRMYGPDTSYRRNLLLQRRKELKKNKTIAQGFIDYPAKLYVKHKKEDAKYTLLENYSNVEIPIAERMKK